MMFQIKFKNSLITLFALAGFALFAAAPAYSQDKVIVRYDEHLASRNGECTAGGLYLIGYLAPDE